MKINYIHFIIAVITSFLLTLIITPVVRKIAVKFNLVDKPSDRKVHKDLVPLVGGIVLLIVITLSLLISGHLFSMPKYLYVIFSGATLLLIVGVIDDKIDIRASLKLLIQVILAYYVFENGIRIEALYGVFGINSLPVFFQYVLTLVIITGVINAFNLMDGIDGLALGLAILSLLAYTFIAIILDQPLLALICLTLVGSLIALLGYNFSLNNKIFMGDAGSLFLGFLLITLGIAMIQMAQSTSNISLVLSVVTGVLALPVIDSLRVYRQRLKSGNSLFKADRTHLHHLILKIGLKQKQSSLLIVFFGFGFIILSTFLGNYLGLTIAIVIIFFVFIMLTSVLNLFKMIIVWRQKIERLERG
ncbi:MAG: UDP-GlcNAc:undecaprenyl-phosphate GlcNAc-1-phosphate transferase [Planctomycetota bacterium]|jgi:UDP-GlcNAc:undecaprenyl-phosphate GlcNAc-1-phosphate transferase